MKGIKNNQGKLIKYISIDEEMDDKSQKMQKANKNKRITIIFFFNGP